MEKIHQDITDIEIILVDPSNTLSIHAHKNVLACSSTYFQKLFCFGIEKTQSSIRIEVDNAKVAYDVIMSSKIKSTSRFYFIGGCEKMHRIFAAHFTDKK